MKFYLIGFSGQIGSSLRRIFNQDSKQVFLLGRKPPSNDDAIIHHLQSNESFIQYDLNYPMSEKEIDINDDCTVIHCAHDFDFNGSLEDSTNLIGTLSLVNCFLKCKSTKFIYLSTPYDLSTTSRASFYQEQKIAIEKIFNQDRDLIISPSYLFSKDSKTTDLLRFFQKLKLPIPIPSKINKIAPINLEDFSSIIYSSLISKNICGKYLIIGSKEQSFKLFLETHYQIKSFQLPSFLFRFIATLLKILTFNYLSERLLGLLNLPNLKKLKEIGDYLEINQNSLK